MTWETDVAWIMRHAKKHGVAASQKKFGKWLAKAIDKEQCRGLCMNYGDRNTDQLIWLRKRPQRASD